MQDAVLKRKTRLTCDEMKMRVKWTNLDDAFAVPDAEAELVGKSSLELADASVAMIYKVHISLFDFVY